MGKPSPLRDSCPLFPQGYALNPLPPLGVDQFSIAEWLSFRLPLPHGLDQQTSTAMTLAYPTANTATQTAVAVQGTLM